MRMSYAANSLKCVSGTPAMINLGLRLKTATDRLRRSFKRLAGDGARPASAMIQVWAHPGTGRSCNRQIVAD
jgi:hypothetical protein